MSVPPYIHLNLTSHKKWSHLSKSQWLLWNQITYSKFSCVELTLTYISIRLKSHLFGAHDMLMEKSWKVMEFCRENFMEILLSRILGKSFWWWCPISLLCSSYCRCQVALFLWHVSLFIIVVLYFIFVVMFYILRSKYFAICPDLKSSPYLHDQACRPKYPSPPKKKTEMS